MRSARWHPTLCHLGYPYVFETPFGIAGAKGIDPAETRKFQDVFKKAPQTASPAVVLATYDMPPPDMANAAYTDYAGKYIA